MSNSQAVADDGLRLTGTINSIRMAIIQPKMPISALMVAQLKNIANPPCDPTLLEHHESQLLKFHVSVLSSLPEATPKAVSAFPSREAQKHNRVFSEQVPGSLLTVYPHVTRNTPLEYTIFKHMLNV